jgi:hypothetical protein
VDTDGSTPSGPARSVYRKLPGPSRSSGLPAIGNMTLGRSAVIASKPRPRVAASTTAEREAYAGTVWEGDARAGEPRPAEC